MAAESREKRGGGACSSFSHTHERNTSCGRRWQLALLGSFDVSCSYLLYRTGSQHGCRAFRAANSSPFNKHTTGGGRGFTCEYCQSMNHGSLSLARLACVRAVPCEVRRNRKGCRKHMLRWHLSIFFGFGGGAHQFFQRVCVRHSQGGKRAGDDGWAHACKT